MAGPVAIGSGSTLTGTGRTGAIVNNGILVPGDSAGTITINGNYVQSATGAFQVQIGGSAAVSQYDQLSVNGSVTLGGSLDVSLISGFIPGNGNSFTIIDNDGTDAVAGNFAGLPDGALIHLVR